MKFSAWAWACALGSTLLLGNVMAQGLRQPYSVRPVGFDYYRFLQDEAASPSDTATEEGAPAAEAESAPVEAAPEVAPAAEPAPAAEAAPAAPMAPVVSPNYGSCDVGCSLGCDVNGCDSDGCDSCLGGCGLFGHGELGEPWTLKSHLGCSPCSPWDVAGFIQFGYQDNPDGAFCGNGPFLNQREWNNVNLNQAYVYISRTADGSNGLGWGGRVDAFYGVDGNEGQSFGNVDAGHFDYLNGWDHGSYEWAMPQLYGELAYGDTSVKLGHFYTIEGYEVVMSTGNFFLSRTLNFWNSEPFTHTGALATTKLTDKLSVWNGWVLGMDTGFYQYAGGNAYLGGISYQLDEDTAVIFATHFGDLGWRGNGAINSLVVTRNWTDKFSTAHQFDVLGSDLRVDAGGVPEAGDIPSDFTTSGVPRDSTGFINYAFYQLTERVKAGARYEWYKADGTSYNTLTGGVNIKPTANLLVRPEIRYMWAPGNDLIYTGSGYSGELFNETVLGIDAIMTF